MDQTRNTVKKSKMNGKKSQSMFIYLRLEHFVLVVHHSFNNIVALFTSHAKFTYIYNKYQCLATWSHHKIESQSEPFSAWLEKYVAPNRMVYSTLYNVYNAPRTGSLFVKPNVSIYNELIVSMAMSRADIACSINSP